MIYLYENKIIEVEILKLLDIRTPFYYINAYIHTEYTYSSMKMWWNYFGDFKTYEEAQSVKDELLSKVIIDTDLFDIGKRTELFLVPIEIKQAKIEEDIDKISDQYNNGYLLKVQDQYGRWWKYIERSPRSYEEVLQLKSIEISKGIININFYEPDDDIIVETIKRTEKILYVYTHDEYGYFNWSDPIPDPDYEIEIRIFTIDHWVYKLKTTFSTPEIAIKFAEKIKKKGFAELEFWVCLGSSFNKYFFDDNYLELKENTDYFDF